MKKVSVIHYLFLIILILLFSFACKEKPKTSFDDYGDALIDSYKRGQKAGAIANLDAVKKAVSMYYAENGKYPETLEEINEYMRSDIDMSKYDYEPDTGRVLLKE